MNCEIFECGQELEEGTTWEANTCSHCCSSTCVECIKTCPECDTAGCINCMDYDNASGEYFCQQNCQLAYYDSLIEAAKNEAVLTGSHRDLKSYLELRLKKDEVLHART